MPDLKTLAARFLASRKAVATALSAQEIAEHVPQALRDASVFSARTVYAEHVDATRREIVGLLEAEAGPAEIRARMRLRLAKLGYEPDPDKRGGLQDLSSDLRTNLIISMQESRARGYAVWRSQQDEAVLAVWPAQELFRALARQQPRKWRQRWNEARRSLGAGRTSATYAASDAGPFVALKNDPVWAAISRFGAPYPPFDYQSGMRLRNVSARRARELGVLTPDRKPQPRRDPLRGVQSSSAAGMAPEVVRAWAEAFGGRARVSGGRVAVAPEPSVIAEVVDAAEAGAQARAAFGFLSDDAVRGVAQALGKEIAPETVYQIDADAVRHILKRHGDEAGGEQLSVTREQLERLHETLSGPGRWRAATDQEKHGFNGDAVTFFADGGERVAFRVSRDKKEPRLTVQTLYIQARR